MLFGQKKEKKNKTEKIRKSFPHKVIDVANKKVMFIDFGSLTNASFNNSLCRKTVFKLFSYPENKKIDELVFTKSFKRIFNLKQVEMIIDISKKLNGFKKLDLCKECKSKLKKSWEDPIGYYFMLHSNNCGKCKKTNKKIISCMIAFEGL